MSRTQVAYPLYPPLVVSRPFPSSPLPSSSILHLLSTSCPPRLVTIPFLSSSTTSSPPLVSSRLASSSIVLHCSFSLRLLYVLFLTLFAFLNHGIRSHTTSSPTRLTDPERNLEADWKASGNSKLCSQIFPLRTTHPKLRIETVVPVPLLSGRNTAESVV